MRKKQIDGILRWDTLKWTSQLRLENVCGELAILAIWLKWGKYFKCKHNESYNIFFSSLLILFIDLNRSKRPIQHFCSLIDYLIGIKFSVPRPTNHDSKCIYMCAHGLHTKTYIDFIASHYPWGRNKTHHKWDRTHVYMLTHRVQQIKFRKIANDDEAKTATAAAAATTTTFYSFSSFDIFAPCIFL